jgi:5-methylcytosine-specific restriction endonuclease McrA
VSDKSSIQWTEATWLWRAKAAAKRIGVTIDIYIAHLFIGEKWCCRCRAWHSRGVFGSDASRYDGLAASCRPVRQQRERLSREERRKRDNARYRAYYAGTGGAAIRAQKYARKRGVGPISPFVRELLFELFDGRCAYCQSAATTIDHVVPVSRGGRSERGNLLPACGSCNSRKNARDFEAFLAVAPAPHDYIFEELAMAEVL